MPLELRDKGMTEQTSISPIGFHLSFATQLRPPDVMEQYNVRNHVCKDFKQFSYSISCRPGVASVLSRDEEQTVRQPIADGSATHECPALEHKIPDTSNFARKHFPPQDGRDLHPGQLCFDVTHEQRSKAAFSLRIIGPSHVE
jgi:hypothetical protein